MATETKIGETVEITRKQHGSMTYIMYMERKGATEFVVKPKWQGSICFLMEKHQTFTNENKARSWARSFVR